MNIQQPTNHFISGVNYDHIKSEIPNVPESAAVKKTKKPGFWKKLWGGIKSFGKGVVK